MTRRRARAQFVFAAGIALVALAGAALLPVRAADDHPIPPPPPAGKVDFNRDVQPLLSDRCYFCHGPDASKRKAKLRLDTQDGLLAPHEDRVTVVPGNI